ncbi:MAG: hypothetical protein Q8N23_04510 [Archangium sp.]|nr:hypothetical protein [Archangium sp.]MDP3151905.1 hypothetical protein [Archangium sp.]MDP3571318.1 hypothetical protein [Archangium sp.]
MRTQNVKWMLSGAVFTVLVGCGVDDTTSVRQNVTAFTCPADQRPWDFGRFPNGHTSEQLQQLRKSKTAADSGVDALENTMSVESLSCSGFAPVLKAEDLAVAKALCDGKSSCFPLNEVRNLVSCSNASYPEWKTSPKITYRCSGENGQVHTEFAYSASCALRQAWSDKTVCVPENCYGRTSRDINMQCVPDLLKPVETAIETTSVTFDSVARTLLVPGEPDGQAIALNTGLKGLAVTLDQDQLYRFKGRVRSVGATRTVPRQLLTLWVSTRLGLPDNGATLIDAVRCVIGKIDLSKYTPSESNGQTEIAFDETLRIPPSCSTGEAFTTVARTAWRAQGYDVSSPTLRRPTNSDLNQLEASYDLEGHALVLQDLRTATENSCSTKPIDFFFNYTAGVHDALGYYRQNRLAVTSARGNLAGLFINERPKTLLRPSEVNVRGLEFRVNKQGRVRGDIPVDLILQMSGPESEVWRRYLRGYRPMGSVRRNGMQQVTGGVDWTRIYFQFEGVTRGSAAGTGFVPVPDPTLKDGDGNVVVDTSAMIPLPADAMRPPLDGLSESGSAQTLSVPLTNALRTALFNPAGRYPLKPGERRTYVLQFCTEATPRFFSAKVNWNYKYNATRTDLVRVEDPGVVEQVQVPLSTNAWAPTRNLESAVNRCARSGLFTFYGEDIVLPLAETENGGGDNGDSDATTSGESRMSANFDPSFDRHCTGAVGAEVCSTTMTQELGGSGGPLGSTIFSLTSDADEEGDTEDMSESLKILGFNVLKLPGDDVFSETENTITFAPKLETLGRKAKQLGAPIPFFHAEARSFSADVKGLAVGLEFAIPLRFGPVQGDLTFSLAGGVGLGFELTHTYNGNVGTTCAVVNAAGEIVDQPCSDVNTALPSMPLKKAREVCATLGGQLAEPRTDAALALMRAALPATTEAWVGAQVGNEYRPNTDCLTTWSSAVCANGHATYMRWLSDGTNFLKASTFGPFQSIAAPTTLDGTSVTAAVLATQRPVASGVTLKGTEFGSRSIDALYPSVCVRPRITTGSSHELKLAMKLGFAAGFGVEFCTPSADSPFALCLGGSVNIIEASLLPSIAFTYTRVKDNAGRTAVNSSMVRSVDWEVKILTGSIEVKVVTPFTDFSYALISFGGFSVAGGNLANDERAFKQEIQ